MRRTKKSVTLIFIAAVLIVISGLIIIRGDLAVNSTGATTSDVSKQAIDVIMKKRDSSKFPLEFPLSLADRVRAFVLFIGHTHSSHSIVASVLDSHPHMVVSHESGIVPALVHKFTSVTYTKDYMFNCIWRSSYKSVHGGKRAMSGKGYNLTVDKEWQGNYDKYVDVFGDDEAHVIPNSLIYVEHRKEVQDMLKRLPSLVGVPVKMFHVIRNPYDNIATDVLYRTFSGSRHQVFDVKRGNESIPVNQQVVKGSIYQYFGLYKAAEYVKKRYKFSTMTIHIKDVISHPKSMIAKICKFLGVACSKEYVDNCSKKIFKSESRTRYKINWQNQQIAIIQSAIQKFDNLKRYKDFDS